MKLNDFMAAMQAIESDRQLSKEIVVDALQEALSKAFRKHIEIPDACLLYTSYADTAIYAKCKATKNR